MQEGARFGIGIVIVDVIRARFVRVGVGVAYEVASNRGRENIRFVCEVHVKPVAGVQQIANAERMKVAGTQLFVDL